LKFNIINSIKLYEKKVLGHIFIGFNIFMSVLPLFNKIELQNFASKAGFLNRRVVEDFQRVV
jgi:hypothetical protein